MGPGRGESALCSTGSDEHGVPANGLVLHGREQYAGDADPACKLCGGILKSDTISFGQAQVPAVIDRAMAAASVADLMIAVGSTLQVYPAAGVVPLAKESGARIVILNDQPTPLDSIADAVLRGAIGEVLPRVCQA